MAARINLCMNCLRDMGVASNCPHCRASGGRAANRPPAPAPGTVLRNRYLVGGLLHVDWMGVHCLGLRLDRIQRVVLIQLAQPPHGSADSIRKLIRHYGADGHASLDWPLDCFTAGGHCYLVRHYVAGGDLDDKLRASTRGRLDSEEAACLLLPVLNGLQALHDAGFLHLRITPETICPGPRGLVLFFDGGVSGDPGSASMQSPYAAPEMFTSRTHMGPWTDVYACAAILYRCVTGLDPLPAAERICGGRLTRPSRIPGVVISRPLEQAMLWGLETMPSRRPDSMGVFMRAVQNALAGRAPGPRRLSGRGARPRALYAAVLVVAVLLFGMFLGGLWGDRRQVAPSRPTPARIARQLTDARTPVSEPRPDRLPRDWTLPPHDRQREPVVVPPAETAGRREVPPPDTVDRREVPPPGAAETAEALPPLTRRPVPPPRTRAPEWESAEDTVRDRSAPHVAQPSTDGPSPTAATDITDLVDQGRIEVELRLVSLYEMEIRARRLVEEPVTVYVPVGAYFVSRDTSKANMVVTRAHTATLTSEDEEVFSVYVANMDQSLETADDQVTFVPYHDHENAQLHRLLDRLTLERLPYPVAQAAVWIVVNDADFTDMGVLEEVKEEEGYLHPLRVITASHAARAMRLCAEAGLDMTQKQIWAERHEIMSALEDDALIRWLETL